MSWKNITVIAFLLVACILGCLFGGWRMGYNDGALTTVVIARPYMTQNETLSTLIAAERVRTDIFKLRATNQLNLDEEIR